MADYSRLQEGQTLVVCGDCEIVLFVCETREYKRRYVCFEHRCPRPKHWRIRGTF